MAESIFGIHERALQVRTMRGEVLASNLANADTPNYKARDVDFRQALRAESDKFAKDSLPMAHTSGRHMTGDALLNTQDFLKYRMPTQPSLDGNTVEAHIEKAQYMENAMQHQATLEFIDSKIQGIRGALKGE
ncbi:flagellar basal body rod protein FlgB [Thiosulfatimonas sediminis]|uniref:Flagellar basal body rod protein FlgB n=1 Tax=Thiosulfatimonas sediminis TaxID=2675054 RepID=A0A6F8PTQ9_9GAMM|nr:flagellar basal body rod protein FlgB [Thiosulfatimonas sediminis]BBP45505.1 flagellar basal body rod protein FlgB [Thiosulfatimonas sediminis]